MKSTGNPNTGLKTVETFCKSLVKTAGVLLLPGSVYDDSGNHFRIGFGRQNLPEAIGRLEDFLLRL
jgi:aspartate/methionine/tyrosine aminotransferase